jgi:hypothetical protein
MKILVVQESDWLEKGPHQSHHLMERMSARGHEVRVIDFEIQWKLPIVSYICSNIIVSICVVQVESDYFIAPLC